MNIQTDWILQIKKRFQFCSGFISAERLADYAKDCFVIGVHYLYKWRKFDIEQPKEGDIVVVRPVPGAPNVRPFTVCFYNGKQLIRIDSKTPIPINGSFEWKLIETNSALNMPETDWSKDECSPCKSPNMDNTNFPCLNN